MIQRSSILCQACIIDAPNLGNQLFPDMDPGGSSTWNTDESFGFTGCSNPKYDAFCVSSDYSTRLSSTYLVIEKEEPMRLKVKCNESSECEQVSNICYVFAYDDADWSFSSASCFMVNHKLQNQLLCDDYPSPQDYCQTMVSQINPLLSIEQYDVYVATNTTYQAGFWASNDQEYCPLEYTISPSSWPYANFDQNDGELRIQTSLESLYYTSQTFTVTAKSFSGFSLSHTFDIEFTGYPPCELIAPNYANITYYLASGPQTFNLPAFGFGNHVCPLTYTVSYDGVSLPSYITPNDDYTQLTIDVSEMAKIDTNVPLTITAQTPEGQETSSSLTIFYELDCSIFTLSPPSTSYTNPVIYVVQSVDTLTVNLDPFTSSKPTLCPVSYTFYYDNVQGGFPAGIVMSADGTQLNVATNDISFIDTTSIIKVEAALPDSLPQTAQFELQFVDICESSTIIAQSNTSFEVPVDTTSPASMIFTLTEFTYDNSDPSDTLSQCPLTYTLVNLDGEPLDSTIVTSFNATSLEFETGPTDSSLINPSTTMDIKLYAQNSKGVFAEQIITLIFRDKCELDQPIYTGTTKRDVGVGLYYNIAFNPLKSQFNVVDCPVTTTLEAYDGSSWTTDLSFIPEFTQTGSFTFQYYTTDVSLVYTSYLFRLRGISDISTLQTIQELEVYVRDSCYFNVASSGRNFYHVAMDYGSIVEEIITIDEFLVPPECNVTYTITQNLTYYDEDLNGYDYSHTIDDANRQITVQAGPSAEGQGSLQFDIKLRLVTGEQRVEWKHQFEINRVPDCSQEPLVGVSTDSQDYTVYQGAYWFPFYATVENGYGHCYKEFSLTQISSTNNMNIKSSGVVAYYSYYGNDIKQLVLDCISNDYEGTYVLEFNITNMGRPIIVDYGIPSYENQVFVTTQVTVNIIFSCLADPVLITSSSFISKYSYTVNEPIEDNSYYYYVETNDDRCEIYSISLLDDTNAWISLTIDTNVVLPNKGVVFTLSFFTDQNSVQTNLTVDPTPYSDKVQIQNTPVDGTSAFKTSLFPFDVDAYINCQMTVLSDPGNDSIEYQISSGQSQIPVNFPVSTDSYHCPLTYELIMPTEFSSTVSLDIINRKLIIDIADNILNGVYTNGQFQIKATQSIITTSTLSIPLEITIKIDCTLEQVISYANPAAHSYIVGSGEVAFTISPFNTSNSQCEFSDYELVNVDGTDIDPSVFTFTAPTDPSLLQVTDSTIKVNTYDNSMSLGTDLVVEPYEFIFRSVSDQYGPQNTNVTIQIFIFKNCLSVSIAAGEYSYNSIEYFTGDTPEVLDVISHDIPQQTLPLTTDLNCPILGFTLHSSNVPNSVDNTVGFSLDGTSGQITFETTSTAQKFLTIDRIAYVHAFVLNGTIYSDCQVVVTEYHGCYNQQYTQNDAPATPIPAYQVRDVLQPINLGFYTGLLSDTDCGQKYFSVTDGAGNQINSQLFTFLEPDSTLSESEQIPVLQVQTDDATFASDQLSQSYKETYVIQLNVKQMYLGETYFEFSYMFQIYVQDLCYGAIQTSTFVERQIYSVNSPTKSLVVPLFKYYYVGNTYDSISENQPCGKLIYDFSVPTTAQGIISQQGIINGVLVFDIFTPDSNQVQLFDLEVIGRFQLYPYAYKTHSLLIEVLVNPCQVTDPSANQAIYDYNLELNEPLYIPISYSQSPCQEGTYDWNMTAFIVEPMHSYDLPQLFTFYQTNNTLKVETTLSVYSGAVFKLNFDGILSDVSLTEFTPSTAWLTIQVLEIQEESLINNPPLTENAVENQEIQVGESLQYDLGKIIDPNGDEVLFELNFNGDQPEWITFEYSEESGLSFFFLSPPEEAKGQTYTISLTVTDTNAASQTFEFSVYVEETPELPEEFLVNSDSTKPQSDEDEEEKEVTKEKEKEDKATEWTPDELVIPDLEIDRMTVQGTFMFRFDMQMQFPSNWTDYNSTNEGSDIIDIKIIPSAQSDPEQLGFNWTIVDVDETTFEIMVVFENYLQISNSGGIDQLFIDVKEPSFFISRADGLSLDIEKQYQIKYSIPRQLGESSATQGMIDALTGSQESLMLLVASNAGVSILIESSIKLLWSMLNTVQIMVYTSLFNIQTPSNSGYAFIMLLTIIQLEGSMDPNPFYDKVFEFPFAAAYTQIFEISGFFTSNFLRGIGSLPFVVILVFLMLIARNLCLKMFRYLDECSGIQYLLNMGSTLKQAWVRYVLQTYLEFNINAAIAVLMIRNTPEEDRESKSNRFQWFCAALCIFSSILQPIIISVFACKYYNDIKKKDLTKPPRHEELFKQFRKKPWAVHYNSIFLVRRIFFLTCLMLKNVSNLQIFVFIESTCFMFSYLAITKPFMDKHMSNIELFNESLLLILSFSLLSFSNLVLSPEARYQVGWFEVGITLLCIFSNLIYITAVNIMKICTQIRRWRLKRKMQKAMRYKIHKQLNLTQNIASLKDIAQQNQATQNQNSSKRKKKKTKKGNQNSLVNRETIALQQSNVQVVKNPMKDVQKSKASKLLTSPSKVSLVSKKQPIEEPNKQQNQLISPKNPPHQLFKPICYKDFAKKDPKDDDPRSRSERIKEKLKLQPVGPMPSTEEYMKNFDANIQRDKELIARMNNEFR